MKYMKIFSLICCCLLCNIVLAQEENDLSNILGDKVPVSPNAASLGIFGAIPVGHYTGVPSISIPIYEIDLDGKKIPISLSYHASGIKVNQEASWVGLGWALNAGGMISKQVNGGDDFGQSTVPLYGYYWNTTLASELEVLDHEGYSYAELSKFNDYIANRDTEADVYSFNFGSHSGTMFIGNLNYPGNTEHKAKALIRNSQEYLDASYILDSDSWIIYDENGYAYYFKSKENTRVYAKSLNAGDLNDWGKYINKLVPDRTDLMRVSTCTPEEEGRVSSWMLDSIKSPLGRKITFEYDYQWIYSTISFSESDKRNVGVKKVVDFTETIQFSAPHTITYSFSKIRQAVLKKITFDDGEIGFQVSDRFDIEGTEDEKVGKLDKIEIKDLQGNVIKQADFSYSYLGNTSSNYTCRLFLDEVRMNDDERYILTYNKNTLPSKHSLCTDYWGYYNGRNITYYSAPPFYYSIPGVFYTNIDGKLNYMPGQNKSVNPVALENGMLTSIKYPTGGESCFVYEPNDYVGTANDVGAKKLKDIASVGYSFYESDEFQGEEWDPSTVYSEPFEIDFDNINAVLDFSGEPTSGIESYGATVGVGLQKYNGNSFDYIQIGKSMKEIVTISKNNPKCFRVISPLSKGTYRLTMEKDNYERYFWVDCRLACEYQEQVSLGAGLRIKKIINKSGDKTETREFDYSYPNGLTSGKCMTGLGFHRKTIQEQISFMDANYWDPMHPIKIAEAHFLEATARLYTPLSYAAQGSPIGYSRVTEKVSGNLGKTVYSFHNEVDEEISVKYAFDQIPTISDFRNGLPLGVSVYGASNTIVDSINYRYEQSRNGQIKSFKVFLGEGFTKHSYFDYPQESATNKLIEKKHYTYNGGTKMEQITTYSYHPTYHVKRTEKTNNSDGTSISTLYRYSFDDDTSIHYKLQDKHIVGLPLEVISMKDNEITSAGKIEYKEDMDMLLPYKYLVCNGHNATLSDYANYYQPELEVTRFTTKGKELEKVGKDGLQTVYLWGYRGNNLIAEIKNASYDEVKAYLSTDLLNRLQTDASPSSSDLEQINSLRNKIPKAIVTTFEYKPLIGPILRIEPNGIKTYYEYDNKGRLIQTEDNQNKVLNTYEYHYAN